jgi:hypothetical protein
VTPVNLFGRLHIHPSYGLLLINWAPPVDLHDGPFRLDYALAKSKVDPFSHQFQEE